MCTAVSFKTKNRYFGRNLDYEYSYNETVTVTPRKFPFEFRAAGRTDEHYAMIGMAFVEDGYPLYYKREGSERSGAEFSRQRLLPKACGGQDQRGSV